MKKATTDYKLLSGLFFRLLPFQMLLIIINAVNGIVDSLYASNAVGKAAMNAIGLFAPLNHCLYAISILLVSGSQLLYGRYLHKEPQSVRSVFSVNLLLSAGVSLLISTLLVLGVVTGGTARMVTNEEELRMLNRYLLGQAPGIPALVVGQQLFSFLSLENKTRRTMAASISCFAVNLLADHLFVVLFSLDTLGLGLGSSLAEWVFLAVQAVYYLSGKSELTFSLRACRSRDVPRILSLGYSGAISRFVEMFRCILVNMLILRHIGSVGISSFAASNSLLAIVWALPFGMIGVARMLFSISIGEEDRQSLTDVMRIVLRQGVPLMITVSALLILCAEPLTRLFYRDVSDPVYGMTVMGFRLLPLCMPLAVISLHFACYAQAVENRFMSVALPVLDGFLGVSATSLLLIPMMKMNSLYLANILNGVICTAFIFIYAWVRLHRYPKTMEELMVLPAGFGASREERIDLSVRNLSEVTKVSRHVITFCEERGLDARRSMFAGLALEEMAGNIVSHGFTKDRKNHTVDIRVAHKDGELILRLRDNCIPFNPSEHLQIIHPEDPSRNVGIRIVYSLAKSVQYQNLLGLNVLTIRI